MTKWHEFCEAIEKIAKGEKTKINLHRGTLMIQNDEDQKMEIERNASDNIVKVHVEWGLKDEHDGYMADFFPTHDGSIKAKFWDIMKIQVPLAD
jgi:hypothetical protein